MKLLIFGLLVFLGAHSVRMVADGWRTQLVQKWGEGRWKGVYSVVSLVGFGLLCWGYAQARQQPLVLWVPAPGMRHLAALLMLFGLVLLAAAYVPRNGIKARVHHPMVLSVKVWALSHLLVNGNLEDVLLFGSFLAWSVACFVSMRRRDRAAGTVYPPGLRLATAATVGAGVVAWSALVFFLHRLLIGVPIFG